MSAQHVLDAAQDVKDELDKKVGIFRRRRRVRRRRMYGDSWNPRRRRYGGPGVPYPWRRQGFRPWGVYGPHYRFNQGYRRMRGKGYLPKSIQVPKLTVEEAGYINGVVNPFGNIQGGRANGYFGGAKIPDASGGETVALSLSMTFTWTPNPTETMGVIKLHKLGNDQNYGLQLHHDEGGSPGHVDTHEWTMWAPIRAYLRDYRIVGMGLKVTACSGLDHTTGILQGGNGVRNIQTAAAVWATYTDIRSELETGAFSVLEGMTVRWVPESNSDLSYETLGNHVAYEGMDWRAPTIYFEGLNASNTTLVVSAVMHVEARLPAMATAFAATLSPVSTRFNLLYAIVTSPYFSPIVTKGNSFRGFFRSASYWTKKIATWIAMYGPSVSQYAGQVAALL